MTANTKGAFLFMAIKHVICEVCGTKFSSYNPTPRFCSKRCKAISQTANIDPADAVRLYESGMSELEVGRCYGMTQKAIVNLFKRIKYVPRTCGKKDQWKYGNHQWLGDKAGYGACHDRVKRARGMPKKCEVCGTDDPKKTYHWANLTGNYSDINDYKRMCQSCHWKYDGLIRNIGENTRRKMKK